MKAPRLLLFTLMLAAAAPLRAQSERDLLETAGRQEAALNENGAFETLKVAARMNPSSYPALWKLSELCSRIGKRQPKKEQQLEFYRLGLSYAQRAVTVNPSGADGHYVLAVAMGRLAMNQSGRERVHSAKEIRAQIEKALQLNPNHAHAWHVLGKWHYEVNNLGMLEKAALRIVYGGLPPASLRESIACYEKARSLDPDFALNYLELAKAYHRNDQNDKAFECLRKLSTMPIRTGDDPHIKQEGARLVREWQ